MRGEGGGKPESQSFTLVSSLASGNAQDSYLPDISVSCSPEPGTSWTASPDGTGSWQWVIWVQLVQNSNANAKYRSITSIVVRKGLQPMMHFLCPAHYCTWWQPVNSIQITSLRNMWWRVCSTSYSSITVRAWNVHEYIYGHKYADTKDQSWPSNRTGGPEYVSLVFAASVHDSLNNSSCLSTIHEELPSCCSSNEHGLIILNSASLEMLTSLTHCSWAMMDRYSHRERRIKSLVSRDNTNDYSNVGSMFSFGKTWALIAS